MGIAAERPARCGWPAVSLSNSQAVDAAVDLITDPQIWLAFATLTALELVLGIDNIVFISILVDKLPPEQRNRARRI